MPRVNEQLSFEKIGSAFQFVKGGTKYHLSTVGLPWKVLRRISDCEFSYRECHCEYTDKNRLAIIVEVEDPLSLSNLKHKEAFYADIYDQNMHANIWSGELVKDELMEMIEILRSKVKAQEEEIRSIKTALYAEYFG